MDTLTTVAAADPPLGEERLPFDRAALLARLGTAVAAMRFDRDDQRRMRRACRQLCDILAAADGATLADRWADFERRVWPAWLAGRDRPRGEYWTWGVRAIVTARLVRPGWELVAAARIAQWVARLPDDAPLAQLHAALARAVAAVTWVTGAKRAQAVTTGLRLVLAQGYQQLAEISEDDLRALGSRRAEGADALDAALCHLGVFARTPQRGATRHARRARRTPAELVAASDIPARFRPVTVRYLEAYAARISDAYATLRHKLVALGHFWRFLDAHYPAVRRCAEVRPAQARAFIPFAIARARLVHRGGRGTGDRETAHAWASDVRTFFADVCTRGAEADSPFAQEAPPAVPLTRHDLVGVGFEQIRRRRAAQTTATVLDLARELPAIRAHALRRWQGATAAPAEPRAQRQARDACWDWALLELLVQSGLRVEEACELTTLDILKRQLPDGRVYYLLHVKPSKYDRARVIPIGDGLGRVLAEIIRQVKRFHGTDAVPPCDHWDRHEQRPLPRAPYLLQGAEHPSVISVSAIRARLRRLSLAAGARTAAGTPLVLLPHDCRRVFASEHLNNHTPVHVIQALLGHATPDTVMVYAKLYPTQLVEAYRAAVRGAYTAFHGEASLRNPTAEEWAAFAASCSLRDMGTHLCALPTGEHCPKGLVCLGCSHAQPKRSAAPVFRRMLASHERALRAAEGRAEPAGQLAARELEIARIRGALQRAEELPEDVAAAIEAAAG